MKFSADSFFLSSRILRRGKIQFEPGNRISFYGKTQHFQTDPYTRKEKWVKKREGRKVVGKGKTKKKTKKQRNKETKKKKGKKEKKRKRDK